VGVESQVVSELEALGRTVSAVEGCLVATSDGLLVSHTLPDEDPAQIAALMSTVVGVARHAVLMTGRGDLQEAAVRGADGYVVVYAVGDTAVLAVVARADLNVALLQLYARPVVRRLAMLSPGFTRFVTSLA
jgi:predicted regulator of Ras-like GTPase activity (Roadblock/LC7/MglB family)